MVGGTTTPAPLNLYRSEPRPKGLGVVWEGLRTPPKADLNYLDKLFEKFFLS
jgi:hypothetical protein